MKPKRKIWGVVVKGIDRERGIITFMGTTPTKDRYGDIVVPQGAELENYRANPVFLWAHNYSQPPIGKALDVRVIDDVGVEFRIQFDMADEFAVQIFRKYADGFLSAVSIGFSPIEWERLESKESYFAAYKYTKWDCLELSAVPVPANPEALQNALAKAMAQGTDPEEVARLVGLAYGATPNDAEPSGLTLPVIVEVETEVRDAWKCPHCEKEIGEKELYCPDLTQNQYVHRSCKGLVTLPDSDSPGAQTRAGAVLSKKNKGALEQAQGLIQQVLDSAMPPEDDDDHPMDDEKAAPLTEVAARSLFREMFEQFLTELSAPKAVGDKAPVRSPNPSPAQLNPDVLFRAVKQIVQRRIDAYLTRATGRLPENL